jgi:hypothetical protein
MSALARWLRSTLRGEISAAELYDRRRAGAVARDEVPTQ